MPDPEAAPDRAAVPVEEAERGIGFDPWLRVEAEEEVSLGRGGDELLLSPPYRPPSLTPSTLDIAPPEGRPSARGGPSAVTPVYDATFYPYSSIVKLRMRFGSYLYVCSGFLHGEFLVATAGHCIDNHDPNDDGPTADASWADEIWVHAGQGDVVGPLWTAGPGIDRPWGPAKSVYLRSYVGGRLTASTTTTSA